MSKFLSITLDSGGSRPHKLINAQHYELFKSYCLQMQAKSPYIMYQSKLESFVHKVLDIVCL